jgi:hypothetical protein
MATTIHETGRHIALDEIRVPENVRALDAEHVKALAGSIGNPSIDGPPNRLSAHWIARAA